MKEDARKDTRETNHKSREGQNSAILTFLTSMIQAIDSPSLVRSSLPYIVPPYSQWTSIKDNKPSLALLHRHSKPPAVNCKQRKPSTPSSSSHPTTLGLHPSLWESSSLSDLDGRKIPVELHHSQLSLQRAHSNVCQHLRSNIIMWKTKSRLRIAKADSDNHIDPC